ncbi:MAG: GNAT family N-acetyltransferase, partial [Verrucomicrobia bacterium]|nr:GNAT family N-acetyltransferase [Verrucomicrobiota bacterium]
ARFLLQWAGPFYKYPLDAAQLLATFEKTKGARPAHYMFAAVDNLSGTVIGHVELMAVDHEQLTAMLGRVLIGQIEERGKGYGVAMVAQALDYGFNTLSLSEIRLGVFDFNKSAILCYKKLGFSEFEFRPNARQFESEFWNLIMMKLNRTDWLVLNHG